MRVLVTGGLGFLGRHFVRLFEGRGDEVTVLDKDEPMASNGTRIISRDLCEFQGLPEFVAEQEVVVHLAATSDTRASTTAFRIDLDNSVRATWNLLEALKGSNCCERFIFISSQHVYGPSTVDLPVKENSPFRPVSKYGAGKAACEAIVSCYAQSHQIPSTILRLSNIVGTGQRYGVLLDFLGRLRADQSQLRLLGSGSQRRNFLHVQDLCSALDRLISVEQRTALEAYNIANRDSMTVHHLAEAVIDELGLIGCPISTSSSEESGWRGDPGSIVCDVTKANSVGWVNSMNCEQAIRAACRELWESL